MGFLGLAVSLRVRECTGSSVAVRYSSLLFPPMLMLPAATVGALAGSFGSQHPLIFAALVAFGIFALVNLVTMELLVEGRRCLEGLAGGGSGEGTSSGGGGDDKGPWECVARAMLFIGLLLVLVADQVASALDA